MFLGEPLRHAWRTVRSSKRMLLIVGFVDLLVALPPAIYWMQRVNDSAAHRPDALSIARTFDADFFADVRHRTQGFDDSLTVLCMASFAVAFLVWPLVKGGYVGLAATRRRIHLGQFLKEGGAVYWKFLRLAIVGAAAYYLLSIGARPFLKQVEEWATTRNETTAERYRLVANLVVVGASCIVATVLEYARVGIRLDRRPGVFVEVGRSALFVLQHPGRTLAMFTLSLAIEAGFIGGIGVLVQLADGGYYTTSLMVLLLLQLTVTLREAVRLFHVAAAWQIRAAEAGEERREPVEAVPEADVPDLLRSPLPWNARS